MNKCHNDSPWVEAPVVRDPKHPSRKSKFVVNLSQHILIFRLWTLTQSSVSAQQKPSARSSTGSAQRLSKWISFTDSSTSVYSDFKSEPTLGGFEPVAPDGLQGLQASRAALSNGLAKAAAKIANDTTRSDMIAVYAGKSECATVKGAFKLSRQVRNWLWLPT